MRISDWSSDVCSSDLSGLARHEQADVVVELIGGSDGPALTLARETLKQGHHFVTANKAMIAHHGLELARAAQTTNAAPKFQAGVPGGRPVIKGPPGGAAPHQTSRRERTSVVRGKK